MTMFDFGHPDYATIQLPAAAQRAAAAPPPAISNAQR
jgi:hypothetical protein